MAQSRSSRKRVEELERKGHQRTPDEQAEFLKEQAVETAEDLRQALIQWKDAEVRAVKARGETDHDEYPTNDNKEALISLAVAIGSLLRSDRDNMQRGLECATGILNQTPCNIDTDDEAWLSENGMNI